MTRYEALHGSAISVACTGNGRTTGRRNRPLLNNAALATAQRGSAPSPIIIRKEVQDGTIYCFGKCRTRDTICFPEHVKHAGVERLAAKLLGVFI